MKNTQRQLAYILALTLGSAISANASTVVLFDNLAASDAVANWLPVNPGGWAATGFTTGSACPDGCALGALTLFLNVRDPQGLDPTDGFALEVVADAGTTNTTSYPGTTTIATMINPPTLPSGWSEAVFTPPGVVHLESETLYWAKLSALSDETELDWLYPFGGLGKWAWDDGMGFFVGGEGAPPMLRAEAEPLAPVPVPAAVWLFGSGLLGRIDATGNNVAADQVSDIVDDQIQAGVR